MDRGVVRMGALSILLVLSRETLSVLKASVVVGNVVVTDFVVQYTFLE